MPTTLDSWTVVVPCHDAAKTLRACLDAVFGQTHAPGQVIVVDDASTDDSRAIAAEYPCQVIAVDANRGPAAARNTGAAAARGDVLFFLDADIALAPDALEHAAAMLESDARLGLVQGVYAAEPLIDDGPVERYKTLFEHHWRTARADVSPVTLFALTAIRAQAFQETGGFDEALRDGEDVDFGSRLPPHWAVATDPRVLGRHDDVDRLGPMLAEQWRRSLRFAELLARGRRDAPGRPTVRTGAYGPAAVLACAALVATAPLALWTPWLALLPLAAGAVFTAANAGLLRSAAATGPGWAATVLGLHLLYVGTAGAASLLGVLRPAVWAARS